MDQANPIKSIVGRLGQLRNQLLIFAILASLLMCFFGNALLSGNGGPETVVGVILFLAAVVLIFSAFGFYVFAYLRLPTTAQEAAFLEGARKTLTNHQEELQGS